MPTTQQEKAKRDTLNIRIKPELRGPCGCWMCPEERRDIPPMRERAFAHSEFPENE